MYTKIKRLFLENKYIDAANLCKELLQKDSDNPDYWYYLFLADNEDYIRFDYDNMKNELAFNKAISLASEEKKRMFQIEYNFYKYISRFKRLNLLFKHAQYDNIIELYKLYEEVFYNTKLISILNEFEDLEEYLKYYINNNYSKEGEILQALISNFLCICIEGLDIKNLNMYENKHDITRIMIMKYESKLKELTAEAINLDDFEIVDNKLLKYKGNDSIVIIPNGVVEICKEAFKENYNINKVIFPNTLRIIGVDAFYECKALTTVIFNEGLEQIKESAFQDCDSLKRINIPGSVRVIGESAFWFCKELKEVILGEGIEEIADYAFGDCNNLLSITLPSTLKKIYEKTFDCSRLVEIYNFSKIDIKEYVKNVANIYSSIEKRSELIYEENGLVFIKDINENKYYLVNYIGEDSELLLPDNYNGNEYEIRFSAFEDNMIISKVVIPEGIKKIDEKTFSGCGIISVFVPKSVEFIASSAFSYCSFAEVYGLSSALDNLEYEEATVSVFKGNINDSRIKEYNDFIYTIIDDKYYILGYTGVEEGLVLPRDIDSHPYSIMSNAFSENLNFSSLTIKGKIENIMEYAFAGCSNLEKVLIISNIDTIGESAFCFCEKLKTVDIRGDINSIKNDVFMSCSNLNIAYLSGRLCEIGERIFSFCNNLKEIYIEEIVGELNHNILKNLKNIEHLSIEIGPKRINKGDIDNNSLIYLGLNSGIEFIDSEAFVNCPRLRWIHFYGTLSDYNKIKFSDKGLLGSKTQKNLLKIIKFME